MRLSRGVAKGILQDSRERRITRISMILKVQILDVLLMVFGTFFIRQHTMMYALLLWMGISPIGSLLEF